MKGDSGHADHLASFAEIIGATRFVERLQTREEKSLGRQVFKDRFNRRPKADQGRRPCLFPSKGNNTIIPINVVTSEVGNISLRTAQVPEKLVIRSLLAI